MDHSIERKYFVQRTVDFIKALEDQALELHLVEDERILFRVAGRPFEALAMISEDYDLITITTRTTDLPPAAFEDAVKILQSTLQTCWDHCVAVSPLEGYYDLSMAVFIGGFTFEAFEGVVFNLVACSEAIEDLYAQQVKRSKTEEK